MASKIIALVAFLAATSMAAPGRFVDQTTLDGPEAAAVPAKAYIRRTPVYINLRRNASNSTPTPSPPSPPSAVQITHQVTFSGVASDYTAVVKSTVEKALLQEYGLYNSATDTITTGVTIDSTAARRAYTVTFVTHVPSAHAAAAQTAAAAVTVASLNTAITAVASALGVSAALASITVTGVAPPTVANVSPSPTPTSPTTSGVGNTQVLGLAGLVAMAFAFLQ